MAITIDAGNCTGCGSCVDECPLELISLADDVATIGEPDDCVDCGTCVSACPAEAISE